MPAHTRNIASSDCSASPTLLSSPLRSILNTISQPVELIAPLERIPCYETAPPIGTLRNAPCLHNQSNQSSTQNRPIFFDQFNRFITVACPQTDPFASRISIEDLHRSNPSAKTLVLDSCTDQPHHSTSPNPEELRQDQRRTPPHTKSIEK